MKDYLFDLGAMLVGAGLMFVLMYGEVSAEGEPKKPEPFVCSDPTMIEVETGRRERLMLKALHCKTKKLDSAINAPGALAISCVKIGMF